MERIEINGPGSVVVDERDETVKKSRPFLGLFWGLLVGIGLAGVLVFSATITLSILTVVACLVVGMLVGVVWGVVGPAKKPKGPPPSTRVIVQQVPSSRFDDFDRPADEATPTSAPTVADPPDTTDATATPVDATPESPTTDEPVSDDEQRPG